MFKKNFQINKDKNSNYGKIQLEDVQVSFNKTDKFFNRCSVFANSKL